MKKNKNKKTKQELQMIAVIQKQAHTPVYIHQVIRRIFKKKTALKPNLYEETQRSKCISLSNIFEIAREVN